MREERGTYIGPRTGVRAGAARVAARIHCLELGARARGVRRATVARALSVVGAAAVAVAVTVVPVVRGRGVTRAVTRARGFAVVRGCQVRGVWV